MDYVVAGFGLGAVIVLIGFAVRDVGPYLKRDPQADATSAWATFCRSAGGTVVAGGFAICLLTILLLVVGIDDDLGNKVIIGAIVLAAIAIAVLGFGSFRSFAHIQRFERPTPTYAPPRPSIAAPISQRRRQVVMPQPPFEEPPAAWPEPKPEVIASVPWSEVTQRDSAPAEPVIPEETPDVAAPLPAESEPTPPAPRGPFASPLLANVGEDVVIGEVTGFRSSLLADLAPQHAAENGKPAFSSSILADLTAESPPSTASESADADDEPPDTAPAQDQNAAESPPDEDETSDESSAIAGPVIPGSRQNS